MQNMNPYLDRPGCHLSKTHIDLSYINNLFELDSGFCEIFELFQWKRMKSIKRDSGVCVSESLVVTERGDM